MHALPPTAKWLHAAVAQPWLPPVRYGVKPYLEFCESVDQALTELEARYPSRHPMLTIQERDARLLRRRPR